MDSNGPAQVDCTALGPQGSQASQMLQAESRTVIMDSPVLLLLIPL